MKSLTKIKLLHLTNPNFKKLNEINNVQENSRARFTYV